MVRLLYILILTIFFSVGGYAQVMQTTGGAGGNKFRALKADSFLVVPRGSDTANLANPKWGESTTGALFVKTTDSTLWFKVGGQWVQAGGNFTQTVIGNDTTIYEFVIDSTGAAANRVLFAGAKKIRSDSHFLWDSVNNKLVINHFNHSIGGVNTKLYVNGNANLNGSATSQQFRVSQIQQVFNDTTNYKPVIVNSSGDLYKLDRWPAGGGGSGTVTSISQGYGIINSTNPITTTGTQRIDTFAIATRNWRDKLADSLGAIIATKGSGTVTNFSAGDLSPLFTTSEATTTTTPALSFSLSNAGSYTVFGNQTNASAAPSFAKLNINTIDATGTPSATTYLRGDGSWQTISSGGVPSDSLVFQKNGWSQRINTVAWNSGYNGSVGASAAAAAVDSANFIWGRRAFGSGTTGYRNIAMGRAALKSATTAYGNIAIGDSAAATSTITGEFNINIGALTGRALTSGNYNTSIGYETKPISTGKGNVVIGGNYRSTSQTTLTGSNNTFIGHRMAESVSSGNYNVGIGGPDATDGAFPYKTLGALSSGSNNVAIGAGALHALSTNSGNTAIGNNAGINTTGSNNTLVGNNSGQYYSSGSQNTFIGYLSGAGGTGAASTSSSNTGIGTYALAIANGSAAITGNAFNVGIGDYAGVVAAGAASNTFIGIAAGTGAANLTSGVSGVGNMALGSHAALPSLSSNNQIQFWVGGSGGYNALTRFTGGGWLINNTTSAVTSATTSAALEINGTTGAVLFPRLTTTQRDALTATNGMVIYNSTTDKLQVRAAGAWVDLH